MDEEAVYHVISFYFYFKTKLLFRAFKYNLCFRRTLRIPDTVLWIPNIFLIFICVFCFKTKYFILCHKIKLPIVKKKQRFVINKISSAFYTLSSYDGENNKKKQSFVINKISSAIWFLQFYGKTSQRNVLFQVSFILPALNECKGIANLRRSTPFLIGNS